MAKKAAKSATSSTDVSNSGTAPKKASAPRAPKHLKAQASGVVAAVEGFVSALTNTPAEEQAPSTVEPTATSSAIPEVASTVAPPATTTEAPAVAAEEPAKKEVTEDDIRVLAYTFYLNRPAGVGSEAEDWLRAERTLKGL